MNLTEREISHDTFKIIIFDNHVKISGIIEVREPGDILYQFFSDLHNEILEKEIKRIYLDIALLEFMNSSGIKEIVEWVLKLDDLDEKNSYKITFLYNPNILWQESSINTIIYLNEVLLSKQIKIE